jgi:hypothetical protein
MPMKRHFMPGICLAARVEQVVETTDESGPSRGKKSQWLACQVGQDVRLLDPAKFERLLS